MQNNASHALHLDEWPTEHTGCNNPLLEREPPEQSECTHKSPAEERRQKVTTLFCFSFYVLLYGYLLLECPSRHGFVVVPPIHSVQYQCRPCSGTAGWRRLAARRRRTEDRQQSKNERKRIRSNRVKIIASDTLYIILPTDEGNANVEGGEGRERKRSVDGNKSLGSVSWRKRHLPRITMAAIERHYCRMALV